MSNKDTQSKPRTVAQRRQHAIALALRNVIGSRANMANVLQHLKLSQRDNDSHPAIASRLHQAVTAVEELLISLSGAEHTLLRANAVIARVNEDRRKVQKISETSQTKAEGG